MQREKQYSSDGLAGGNLAYHGFAGNDIHPSFEAMLGRSRTPVRDWDCLPRDMLVCGNGVESVGRYMMVAGALSMDSGPSRG
jgi:hypothetical protein